MSTEDHSEGHCKLNQAPLGTTAPQLNRPEAYKKYVTDGDSGENRDVVPFLQKEQPPA